MFVLNIRFLWEDIWFASLNFDTNYEDITDDSSIQTHYIKNSVILRQRQLEETYFIENF